MMVELDPDEIAESIRHLEIATETIEKYIAYYNRICDSYRSIGRLAPKAYYDAIHRESKALDLVQSSLTAMRKASA